MSLGHLAWAVSFILLFLLGVDVISSTGKYNLELVALSFIPLGLLLAGFPVARWFNPPG